MPHWSDNVWNNSQKTKGVSDVSGRSAKIAPKFIYEKAKGDFVDFVRQYSFRKSSVKVHYVIVPQRSYHQYLHTKFFLLTSKVLKRNTQEIIDSVFPTVRMGVLVKRARI